MSHGANHNTTVPVKIDFSFLLYQHTPGKRRVPTCQHRVVWYLPGLWSPSLAKLSTCYLLDFISRIWDLAKSWHLKIPLENLLVFWIIWWNHLGKKNIVFSKNLPFYNIFFFRSRNNYTILYTLKSNLINYDQINFIFLYHHKQLLFVQIIALNIQISWAVKYWKSHMSIWWFELFHSISNWMYG